jgi:hypothetical protein
MKKYFAVAATLAAFAAAGTAPAFAQQSNKQYVPSHSSERGSIAMHNAGPGNAAPWDYRSGPDGGPLSPGGIGTAANSYRGAGYGGPSTPNQ